MGLFNDLAKKVAESQASSGGVYWVPGKFLVLIDRCQIKEGRKSDYFIVEGDNLTSDNAERQPGTRCSWVLDLKNDPAPGNIKAFLAAALNCPAGEIDEDTFKDCISEDNPLNGRMVRLQVSMVLTKKGSEFSKHVWIPVEEDIYDRIDELKQSAGL